MEVVAVADESLGHEEHIEGRREGHDREGEDKRELEEAVARVESELREVAAQQCGTAVRHGTGADGTRERAVSVGVCSSRFGD